MPHNEIHQRTGLNGILINPLGSFSRKVRMVIDHYNFTLTFCIRFWLLIRSNAIAKCLRTFLLSLVKISNLLNPSVCFTSGFCRPKNVYAYCSLSHKTLNNTCNVFPPWRFPFEISDGCL